MIACVLALASCKKGVDGIPGPKGATGPDGKNGNDVTVVGAAGNKGATGDKGAVGNQGPISDSGPSNIIASGWVKADKWVSKTKYNPSGTFGNILFLCEVPMSIITAQTIEKDFTLNYVKYTDKNGEQRVVLCGTDYRFSDLNLSKFTLDVSYSGMNVGFILLSTQSQIISNVSTGTINQDITQLTNLGMEVRTIIIKSVVKGRSQAVNFEDYDNVCKIYKLNK